MILKRTRTKKESTQNQEMWNPRFSPVAYIMNCGLTSHQSPIHASCNLKKKKIKHVNVKSCSPPTLILTFTDYFLKIWLVEFIYVSMRIFICLRIQCYPNSLWFKGFKGWKMFINNLYQIIFTKKVYISVAKNQDLINSVNHFL